MNLQSVQISGFRCLANIDEIPTHGLTILTGPNDGGKTSVLAALSFLLGGSIPVSKDHTLARAEDADPPGGLEDNRFAEIRVTGKFLLSDAEQEELSLGQEHEVRRVLKLGEAQYEHLTEVSADVALRDLRQKSLEDLRALADRYDVTVAGHRGHKESYTEPLEKLAREAGLERAWAPAPASLIGRIPGIIQFRDDHPEAVIRQVLMATYQATLDGETVRNKLADVERITRDALMSEAKSLETHLQLRCPELPYVRITPEVSFREQFPTVLIASGSAADQLIDLDASGAGLRQRISLATWEFAQEELRKRASSDRSLVICYDEPDNHLDYNHQRALAALMTEQSALQGVSVVVATHSLNLIDRVPIEDVVHLTKQDDRSKVNRLLSTDHQETDRFLADVASAMGLRTSVLLHERCFVVVEGVTEAHAIPILFRKAVGMPLQSAGLALIPASGNAGALQLAKHLVSQGRPVRIIVDQDTYNSTSTKRKFRAAALTAAGINVDHVFRVGSNELEDLFPDQLWADTANAAWPRNDGNTWTAADFEPCRRQPKFSDAVMSTVYEHASSAAPSEKASYLVAVAHQIDAPEEVPSELRYVCERLVEAAHDG